MGFSQSSITSVAPPVIGNGFVKLSWTSTAPAGTWFQVYVDLGLAWHGQTTKTTVALPSAGTAQIDIGTVGSGEQKTSFASSLEGTNWFAQLSWVGGSYESLNLAGFYVYSGPAPGEPVNYTKPVATITAFPQGIYSDGFGDGGFGGGGFGSTANNYGWTSGSLAGGLWNFAVSAFDTAGNVSTPATCSVAIVAPPLEPAFSPATLLRMSYTFDAATEEAMLNWNASPSA